MSAIIHKSKPIAILEWRYREQPDFDEISKIVNDFQKRFGEGVKIKNIETGSNEYAIVIGVKTMSEAEAEAYFLNRYDYDEGKDPDELDWSEVEEHLEKVRYKYFKMGAGGIPALSKINHLLIQLDKGEKTCDLHDEIMSLS